MHKDKKEDKENGEKSDMSTILIVDDDKFLLDMYAVKFQESGFLVTTAFGGMDALTKLEDGFVPDVIITDVVMPIMDGFEFLTEVKNRKLAKSSCIIVLSNLGQKDDVEKGVALGASGYIVKATATPSEVAEKVQDIMKKHHE